MIRWTRRSTTSHDKPACRPWQIEFNACAGFLGRCGDGIMKGIGGRGRLAILGLLLGGLGMNADASEPGPLSAKTGRRAGWWCALGVFVLLAMSVAGARS